MSLIINGRNVSEMPKPSFGKMMVFVDGENLVFRYQAMIEKGRTQKQSVSHKKDVYAWEANTVQAGLHNVIRATYYTSARGSYDALDKIRDDIQALTYSHGDGSLMPNHLFPVVYKKEGNVKGKGVDIQMAVDILKHVHSNNLDTVYLITGDGDYASLIDEVLRSGKQIYVAALSSGLSPKLKRLADKFIDLDDVYFE